MYSLKLLSKRSFANSLYLWGASARLGPKTSDIKQQFSIPKGIPRKIEGIEDYNVNKIYMGMRHSALISEEGKLYTFGSGNWGVLGHGNENDVRFD